MNVVRILILSAAIFLGLEATARAAFTPPFGIPAPPFGIAEQAPASPSPWTTATPGFYYVCNDCPAATDDTNPYGTPAKPRKTIPSHYDSAPLPAGSVVELHGATYAVLHESPHHIVTQGTAAKPVYIRAVSLASSPVATGEWEVDGMYTVVENIKWALDLALTPDKGSVQFGGITPSDHMVLRGCDVHGNANGGEVSVGGTNNVIYKNFIHDGGDLTTKDDQDVHCIQVWPPSSSVWILDNELARCTGDGVQITNTGPSSDINHVYVGRNVSHHHKQSGLWTKSARDVIFSQNTVFGHRPSPSSGGHGIGWQYEAANVWFLFNHSYDNWVGIGGGSSNGDTPEPIFIVGNVIHDIHIQGTYDPQPDGWKQAGINVIGGTDRYVIGNTIYDVDAGIGVAYNAPVHIVNNLIANVTQPQAGHIRIDSAPWDMENNLFFQGGAPARIFTPDGAHDEASVQAAYPAQAKNLTTGDPHFVDAAKGDFHLGDASPARDKGVDLGPLTSGYAKAYGAAMAFDFDGNARPQNGAYDIGAYEWCGGACVPPAAPPATSPGGGTDPNAGGGNATGSGNADDASAGDGGCTVARRVRRMPATFGAALTLAAITWLRRRRDRDTRPRA